MIAQFARRFAQFLLLLGLVIAPQYSFAQNAADDEDDPCAGFIPTKRMMNLMVDRMTDEMGRQYKMSDEQLARTRQIFKDDIVTFVHKNRDQIRPLINQFFEAQLSGEAPKPEDVAGWAKNALPIFTQLDDVITGATDKMRGYFNDDQAMKLDGELAAFRGGVTMVTNKLNSWAEGNYNPETDWDAPGSQERRRREAEEAAKMQEQAELAKAESNKAWEDYKKTAGDVNVEPVGAAPSAEPAPAKSTTAPVAMKDDWEKHVDAFILKYKLDPEQKQKAITRLREAQQQRDDYLRSKSAEMDRIATAMKSAKTDEEKKKAQEDFEKFNAPVNRRYEQLNNYLETLPTRKQRQESGPSEPAPSEVKK